MLNGGLRGEDFAGTNPRGQARKSRAKPNAAEWKAGAAAVHSALERWRGGGAWAEDFLFLSLLILLSGG